MKKRIFLMTVFGFFILIIFTGCAVDGLTYVIDKKLRGKWETQTITYRGTVFNIGNVEIGGVLIKSRGWLFEERTIKLYHNGNIIQTFNDVYSDTPYSDINTLEIYNISDQYMTHYIQYKGNTSLIMGKDAYFGNIDSCKRVNRFSWE